MTYENQFLVGRTYLSLEGKPVKIIAESNKSGPHYRCVQGDDGDTRVDRLEPWDDGITGPNEVYEITPGSLRGWRYDREGDVGRCTAGKVDDPRNLVPGAVPCETCNDNGLIGGPSYAQPDEGGVPCPECCA
jgi:hypothetical protein